MSKLNRERKRANLGVTMMRVAGVLLAVTAVTVWATSFMFARYTTGGRSGSNGRVAMFSVGAGMETGEELLIDVSTGGENGEYVVTLTNNSETAVRGDLELDFTEINTKFKDGSTPIVIIEAITAKVDGAAIELPGENPEDTTKILPLTDNKYIIKGVKDIAPGGNTTVTINLGADALSAEAIKAITESMTGLTSVRPTPDPSGDPAATAEPGGDVELPFIVKAIFTQID